MNYIKKLVKETLNNVETEREREIIREINTSSIKNINDNFSKMIMDIQEEIEKDIMTDLKDYTIYTMPGNEEIYNKYRDILFLANEEDEKKLDIKEVNSELPKQKEKNFNLKDKETAEIFYKRIYLDIEYEEVEKFNEKKLRGTCEITDSEKSEKINIEFKTKLVEEYIEKELEIKRVFDLNQIEWEIQNNTYSRRFFDIYLINISSDLKNEEISNIHINYEEYKNNVYEDYFLLTNLQEKEVLLDKLKDEDEEVTIKKYSIYSKN